MRIAITTPIFVRNDEHRNVLNFMTKSLVSLDHDLVFIPVENYIAPQYLPLPYQFMHAMEEVVITKGRQPQGVSKAWNDGILKAQELECDYVIVCNEDIVFKSNAIDRLVALAQKYQEPGVANHSFVYEHKDVVMWTASAYSDLSFLENSQEDENVSEHPHFSCFMVKPDFFKHVGKFDENFMPAYLEDGDMHARLALSGLKALIFGGSRFYHFGSRVIKSDHDAWDDNKITFPKNQAYFVEKWGHPPVNDVEKMREVYFKHPYNQEDKSLEYWRNA